MRRRIVSFLYFICVLVDGTKALINGPLWDGTGCPKGATGQFPYALDCKKFYNCFHGRGMLSVCAAGTLFNPKTLECDFPGKVVCYASPKLIGGANKLSSSYEEFRDYRNPHHHHYHNAAGFFPQVEQRVEDLEQGQSEIQEDIRTDQGGQQPSYPNSYDYAGAYGQQQHFHHHHHHHHSQQQPDQHSQTGVPVYTAYDRRQRGENFLKEKTTQTQVSQTSKFNSDFESEGVYQQAHQQPSLQRGIQNTDVQPSYSSSFNGPNPTNLQASSGQSQLPDEVPPPSSQILPPPPLPGTSTYGFSQQASSSGFQFKQTSASGFQGTRQVVHGGVQPPRTQPLSRDGQRFFQQPGEPYPYELPVSQPVNPTNGEPSSSWPPKYPNQETKAWPEEQTNVPQQTYVNGQPLTRVTQTGWPPQLPVENSGQSQTRVSQGFYSKNSQFDQNKQYQPVPKNELNSGEFPVPNVRQPNTNYGGNYEQSGLYAGQSSLGNQFTQTSEGSYGQTAPSSIYGTRIGHSSNGETEVGRAHKQFIQSGQQVNPQVASPVPYPTSNFGTNLQTNSGAAAQFNESQTASESSLQSRFSSQQTTHERCPDDYSGLLPHFDCTKFLSCAHGRSYLMDCGPGTRFHPELLICDHAHNVKCASGFGAIESDPLETGETNKQEQVTVISQDVPRYEFVCRNNERLEINLVCDGKNDCSDGSDEIGCPEINCPPSAFKCDKSKCIPSSKTCDGSFDCIDGSDEFNCPIPDSGAYDEPTNPLLDVRFGENIDANKQAEDPEDVTTSTPSHSPRGKELFPKSDSKVTVTQTVSVKVGDRPSGVYSENRPDVEMLQTTTRPSPVYRPVVTSTTHSSPLASQSKLDRQIVRLRGGSSQMEGYVEMNLDHTWGTVCDKKGQWTKSEADLVCRNLGFTRGSESFWQGKPASATANISSVVVVDVLRCTGQEESISDCYIFPGTECDVELDAVWVRCQTNAKSQCHPAEIALNNSCYLLVTPSEDSPSDLAGFSHGEALAHCQRLGGHLIGIQSQMENDFISEWLLREDKVTEVMTAGVGVSVMGMPIWIWEGSEEPFSYQNWWPGWRRAKAMAPQTETSRATCIVMKRYFPCPDTKSKSEDRMCDAQYYFWDVEDCGTMSNKIPYICKRPANKIGCVMGTGVNYRGGANVTRNGNICLPWDSREVSPFLKFRISEEEKNLALNGHNFCRNVGGDDSEPWCFVRSTEGLQKEFCDIPSCSKGVEKSARLVEHKCLPKEFSCSFGTECIPKDWVCDGKPDCSNAKDEFRCESAINKFTHIPKAKLLGFDIEKWAETSITACAQRCLEAENCRSFSYYEKTRECLLSESNIGLSGNLLSNEVEWNYYERKSKSLRCAGLFICDNGKCLSKSSLCNGRDECGDRSDERNCSWLEQGIQLKLSGSKIKNEGSIEIKVKGQWGYICDDQFDINDASVICRHLGYPLGASELRKHSEFQKISGPIKFMIDDLNCKGNESTIADCEHNGWGVHNCNPDEAAGVVCKTAEVECSYNYWQCQNSTECIPLGFLCDNVPDCSDKSDEDRERCQAPISVRLVGMGGESRSNKVTEGRVEVRRFGVWGTVCDDDFGPKEAEVVCNSLGYQGPARAYKEAAFGAGVGIIWLDQVHCFGNETTVSECMHAAWGQTNCKHNEDVAVACSPQKINLNPEQNLDKEDELPKSPQTEVALEDILPKECGRVSRDVILSTNDFAPRVVSGFETIKGAYPWQASVRVRSISGKSTHWCGAVVISQYHILTAGHCLRDYIKSSYFIRAGDYDTEETEGTEQDVEIDEIWIHHQLDRHTRLNNDIALVKLKRPGFKFTSWVSPACLPLRDASYHPGRNCTISGWGSNGSPGSGFARTLHATWLPIMAEGKCKSKDVYGAQAITGGMFCAGTLSGGADSCQGDSGGPFLCPHEDGRMALYGITSWGHGCGRSNSPGVYTRVHHYLDWIYGRIEASFKTNDR